MLLARSVQWSTIQKFRVQHIVGIFLSRHHEISKASAVGGATHHLIRHHTRRSGVALLSPVFSLHCTGVLRVKGLGAKVALHGFQHDSMLVVSEQHRLHTMARALVERAVVI